VVSFLRGVEKLKLPDCRRLVVISERFREVKQIQKDFKHLKSSMVSYSVAEKIRLPKTDQCVSFRDRLGVFVGLRDEHSFLEAEIGRLTKSLGNIGKIDFTEESGPEETAVKTKKALEIVRGFEEQISGLTKTVSGYFEELENKKQELEEVLELIQGVLGDLPSCPVCGKEI